MLNFDSVKKAVNEHDPQLLIGAGSPEDEYTIQIDEIVRIMPFIRDLDTLNKVIYHIFGKWFPNQSFDIKYYEYLANDLWDLREGKLQELRKKD